MTVTKKRSDLFSKILVAATIVVILLFACKLFFIDFYTVSGSSMEPTFYDGQQIFARKVGGASRGDAVVISGEEYAKKAGVYDEKIDLLFKRVIAVEGDVISSVDGVVYLFYDGQQHVLENENYGGGQIDKMVIEIQKTVVPEGYVFVLGDNRNDSVDSRMFGCVKVSDIVAVCL